VTAGDPTRPEVMPKGVVWGWWGLVLVLSAAAMTLRYHTPADYTWTLNLFALPAALWLLAEVRSARTRSPPRLLEWAGTWSYSLYLVHPLVFYALRLRPGAQPDARWALILATTLAASYLFAVLFEFPAHRLAGRVSVG
jgi:peptidoglycan/LPS O-acetylase OafA/YrhL